MTTSEEQSKTIDESVEDPIETQKTLLSLSTRTNNNRHVVPVGILILLFTLYITAAALHRSNTTTNSGKETEQEILSNLQEKENRRQALILGKLLEHEHICNELEIFIKEFKENHETIDNEGEEEGEVEEEMEEIDTSGDDEGIMQEIDESKETTCDKKYAKNVNNKNKIRTKNGRRKLGNGSHSGRNQIKSTKGRNRNKNGNANKKEEAKKKGSTAEPIMYLFALVFIYLLLKAANDINQHYKTEAKGDKRLRRCSLQSYAQLHKQDRRASKESPRNGHKYKSLNLQQRTQSLDRCIESTDGKLRYKPAHIGNTIKFMSVEDPVENISEIKSITRYPSALEKTSAIPSTSTGNTTLEGRRCSVPAFNITHHQQQQYASNAPTVPMSRRTSTIGSAACGSKVMLGLLGNSFDSSDAQPPEIKRRVRMINRH